MNGPELKSLRESMAMLQAVLADRLGITQGRLSQIEQSADDLNASMALAVEMVALKSGRLPTLDHLIGVGRLVYAAGPDGRREALAALAMHMGGCASFGTHDVGLRREAEAIRARYLADVLCDLYAAETHDLATATAEYLALARLAAEHTDATFWIATQYHHLLYRGLGAYLTGRKHLADELPEIVAATPALVPNPVEPMLTDRVWDLAIVGFGRDKDGGHIKEIRFSTSSEALARAHAYAGHFLDIANERAGD